MPSLRRPAAAAASGYSGTPLARKLGIGTGCRLYLRGAPADYAALVAPLPQGVRVVQRVGADTDLMHLFATRRAELARTLALPLALVDIKVCAVDATWSGLKLVIRKSERAAFESARGR